MTELQAANKKEREAKHLRDIRRERDDRVLEDSGTETEAAETMGEEVNLKGRAEAGLRAEGGLGGLRPEAPDSGLRKRRSLGEGSGDLSTDSEWDKVEEADMGR